MEYNIKIPIEARPQMSNQLQVDVPPIEDNDFLPVNREELASAVAFHIKNQPDLDIELFYKEFKDLMKRTKKHRQESDIPLGNQGTDVQEYPIVVSEAILRKLIRRKLLEGGHDDGYLSDDDLDMLRDAMGDEHYDPFFGNELDRLGYGGRDRVEGQPTDPARDSYYAASLEDVASELGFSRASGAKGLQDRAMAKFKLMWENKEAFAALRLFSIDSYVNLMEMFEVLDEGEAEYFRGNPNALAANASWRVFHNLSFVEPLQRKIKKNPEVVKDLVNVASDYYNNLPIAKKEEILDKALEASIK